MYVRRYTIWIDKFAIRIYSILVGIKVELGIKYTVYENINRKEMK